MGRPSDQGNLLDGLRLYFHYVRISVRGQQQYKKAFALQLAGNFAGTIMDFVATWALLARFMHFDNWGLPEVAILYGLVNVAFAAAQSVSFGFAFLGNELLRSGNFDRLLVRPRSVILQLFGQEVRLKQLGRIAQGVVVLTFGLVAGDYLTIPTLVICAWCVIGGTMLFTGLFVLQGTLSFWTTESVEIMNVFTHGGTAVAQYPVSIFSSWLRGFITYVVPLAAVTYFPTRVITGMTDLFSTDGLLCLAAPLAGPIFLLLAIAAFGVGVRRYTSAGG